MDKNKILKLILYISFIPYIALLVVSFYYALNGFDVYTWILPTYVKTIYGMEAFLETLIWNGLKLCYIPILPVCLIFQIIYFIRSIVNKRKLTQVDRM